MSDGTPPVPPVGARAPRAFEFPSAHTGPTVEVDRLCTTSEAQEILGIKRTKLNELVQSGEIRSLKIGKSRRIPASSLQEFISRRLADAERHAQAI